MAGPSAGAYELADILVSPLDSLRLPLASWALSPVMAPTIESFLPVTRSPRLPRVSAVDHSGGLGHLPLGVALGLGGLDLGLALGVLLLAGGGPRRGLARAADGLVSRLNGAADDFLGGADDRVDLFESVGRRSGAKRHAGAGWLRQRARTRQRPRRKLG